MPAKTTETGKKVPYPLRDGVLYSHVDQNIAVHVFAGPKSSKFVCFDVDTGDIGQIVKILNAIQEFGISKEFINVSDSGNKGYHVEIFFDYLIYTEYLARLHDWIMMKTGIGPSEIELRPLHVHSIKLPLCIHPKTGRFCAFLDIDKLLKGVIEPKDVDYIFSIRKFNIEQFKKLLLVAREELKKSGYTNTSYVNSDKSISYKKCLSQDRSDWKFDKYNYPVLQESTRNAQMVYIAKMLKRFGIEREVCYEELLRWFNRQDRNLSKATDREVELDAKSIVKWAYR